MGLYIDDEIYGCCDLVATPQDCSDEDTPGCDYYRRRLMDDNEDYDDLTDDEYYRVLQSLRDADNADDARELEDLPEKLQGLFDQD